ncbi:MAG: inorganic phosphate transporter [Candidatus Omnitrophica bacterium]|nr:inorganic phosphate transporter [Candidatus Omnitrophota bacterium]
MGIETIYLIIAVVLGFYMAWNIGANDMANSMASAVGAKAITLKQAVIISGVLCFIGATFIGGSVTDTIKKGIIDPACVGDLEVMIKGLLATLLAASAWITFATWRAWPVSTTHSIVGALVGFGVFSAGINSINWNKLAGVAISWVTSPLFAGVLAYFIFKIIYRCILSVDESEKASIKIGPVFVGFTFFLMIISLLLKSPLGKVLELAIWQSFFIAVLGGVISLIGGYYFIKKAVKAGAKVEDIFKVLQIMTSCYIAFSIGANDVANAVGPVAGIFSILKNNTLGTKVEVPVALLAMGGVGIAIGMSTWGYRVISTVGSKITELTNSRGFSIDFSAATSVLLASKLGMPVSTTHAVIGAVCGVGLARGLDAVDFRVVKKIIISWVVTIPASAVMCVLFFKFFMWLF